MRFYLPGADCWRLFISTTWQSQSGTGRAGAIFNFRATTQNRARRNPLKRRNASEHFDTGRRLQQLPNACALQAAGFSSLSLIERAFPLWCLGNSAFELLPRREVENENAWAPVYCKEASRIPH